MIDPFIPSRDWYEQYWYSETAAKPAWRFPVGLASVAAFVLAIWLV